MMARCFVSQFVPFVPLSAWLPLQAKSGSCAVSPVKERTVEVRLLSTWRRHVATHVLRTTRGARPAPPPPHAPRRATAAAPHSLGSSDLPTLVHAVSLLAQPAAGNPVELEAMPNVIEVEILSFFDF